MSSQRTAPPQSARRWSGANKAIKAYDHSPLTSPSRTPPLSRKGSSSSIKSTQSEPPWHSGQHSRTQSYDSNASAKTDDSLSSFTSWFKRDKKPKNKKDVDKIILTSKHAAAVKTKMMMDPEYKAFLEKHKKPGVKTANITGGTRHSAHSTAADQEARHPHSGPAHKSYKGLDMPALSKIESKDEPDAEDDIQRARREWHEAQEHNMADILEFRSPGGSAAGSRLHSPIASRDPSPNRRPQLKSGRNSYVGGRYTKNDTGAWVKKGTPPKRETVRSDAQFNPDLLAQSLAERLEALK